MTFINIKKCNKDKWHNSKWVAWTYIFTLLSWTKICVQMLHVWQETYLPSLGELCPNEPMSSHHLKQRQNVQYISHCNQSPVSSEYANNHLITTRERIEIHHLEKKNCCHNKNIIDLGIPSPQLWSHEWKCLPLNQISRRIAWSTLNLGWNIIKLHHYKYRFGCN